ncbi:MAG TPA: HD-GYP domain-containing protein [Firmicutes bacterium]|jgi:HD-GYP domain-containing protein (c-di-GMP phosphodiesterase class II)|nr:HD-GYP domain-containing protein [Bacillota bacterium]
MKILSIDNLKENMQLARSIYSAKGNVLLAEGTYLTDKYIKKLERFGVSTLYITDQRIGQVEVDELVKIQTRNEATKITKKLMTNISKGKALDSEKIVKVVDDIIKELIDNPNIIINLVEMRVMNDYHFSHNVGVCLLALVTGMALNYNDSKLKLLGTGAILHDIGKAKIPLEILNKKGKLTKFEYSDIQKHPQIGYDILKECADINWLSACVAWQHHERSDGSGYPLGIKGFQIQEFSRIVALADVYDAMSTDRIYRKRFLPHQVIEYIRDQGQLIFDPDLTAIFLQNIAPFPIGSTVVLENGERGVVIDVTKDFPTRPVVKVLYDRNDRLLAVPSEKDLKKELTSFVIKVIDDNEESHVANQGGITGKKHYKHKMIAL